jgi:hypothetical protein
MQRGSLSKTSNKPSWHQPGNKSKLLGLILSLLFALLASPAAVQASAKAECRDVFAIIDSTDVLEAMQNFHHMSSFARQCRYTEAISALVDDLKSSDGRLRNYAFQAIERHWAVLLTYSQLDSSGFGRLVRLLEQQAAQGIKGSREAFQILRQ